MLKPFLSLVLVCCLLLFPVACTQNQINQVIADLQLGVNAASVAVPLVLATFAPAAAAPVTAYLGLANQVFGEIARIAASQLSTSAKAAQIGQSIAAIVAQDPSKLLPSNSPPQLQAELGAVANAVKSIAAMFPQPAARRAANKVKLSAEQVERLAAIQVQAQANLGALPR